MNPQGARRYDFGKESCRVILALREDFLPDLEGLRRRLPSIMENRMRLTRMNGRQARDAILASGSQLIAPGVAEKVIAFVAASRRRADEEPVGERELAGFEIEPALLSIVCSELNNKRIRLGQAKITEDLLEGAQQEIVGQFYASSLAGIDPALQLFIEEQLLTAEGYRDTQQRGGDGAPDEGRGHAHRVAFPSTLRASASRGSAPSWGAAAALHVCESCAALAFRQARMASRFFSMLAQSLCTSAAQAVRSFSALAGAGEVVVPLAA